ncbi:MAG: TolC family protein [Bacteroidia bacterium]|jgi:outer membrane protein TolC
MKWPLLLFYFFGCFISASAQNRSSAVSDIAALYKKAEVESYAVLMRRYDEQIALLTEKAALANAFSIKAPVSATAINNTLIPVNFIPGEIFGGPAGSFKEVQFGQQYISSITFSPQLDVLQPARIAEVPMSKTLHKLAKLQTAQAIEQLKNELAQGYFSILAYREQLQILSKSAQQADSLYQLISSRKEKGLASVQEVNDSRIYSIQQNQELETLRNLITLQGEYLNALFSDSIQIGADASWYVDLPTDMPPISTQLSTDIAELQFTYAVQNLRKVRLDQLPGLSLISNYAWQNNSNSRLFDPSQRWIQSQYVGLKLNWDLPVSANRITSLSLAKIDNDRARLGLQRANEQSVAQKAKLDANFANASIQLRASDEIVALELESFGHVTNRFDAGLLDCEDVLRAHRKVIQSQLNAVSAKATVAIALENIRNAR